MKDVLSCTLVDISIQSTLLLCKSCWSWWKWHQGALYTLQVTLIIPKDIWIFQMSYKSCCRSLQVMLTSWVSDLKLTCKQYQSTLKALKSCWRAKGEIFDKMLNARYKRCNVRWRGQMRKKPRRLLGFEFEYSLTPWRGLKVWSWDEVDNTRCMRYNSRWRFNGSMGEMCIL